MFCRDNKFYTWVGENLNGQSSKTTGTEYKIDQFFKISRIEVLGDRPNGLEDVINNLKKGQRIAFDYTGAYKAINIVKEGPRVIAEGKDFRTAVAILEDVKKKKLTIDEAQKLLMEFGVDASIKPE